MVKRPIFRFAELQQRFMADGFLKIKLRYPEALHAISDSMQSLEPVNGYGAYTGPDGKLITDHVSMFNPNLEYRKQTVDLISQHLTKEFEDLLIDYKVFSASFFIKNPSGASTELHQHWTIADYEHTTLSCWIPLHNVDEQNGALQFVPGSHKIIDHVHATNAAEYFKPFKNQLLPHLETVPLKFGEAVIFCETLIHGGHTNQSDAARKALQISLYPSECNPYVHVDNPDTGQHDRFLFNRELFFAMFDHMAVSIPPGHQKVASYSNRNRPITYNEFLFRLKQGPSIREQLYQGHPPVPEVFTEPHAESPLHASMPQRPAKQLYTKLKTIFKR